MVCRLSLGTSIVLLPDLDISRWALAHGSGERV